MNPWLKLPGSAPYVLEQDALQVERFNVRAKDEHHIRTDAVPVPFLGNPEAPVVLLNLNPGFDPGDVVWQERPEFRQALMDNLGHAAVEKPFFLLDARFHQHPGFDWWTKRLKEVLLHANPGTAERGLLCIEWFPYPSRSFGRPPELESQQYGYGLLRSAIKRQATIVVMHNRSRWETSVPELATHNDVHELNSTQSVYITPRNCPSGFRRVIDRLDGKP